MRKEEFIRELEYALEGRIAEDRATEIRKQYRTLFEGEVGRGKTEEEISRELGSPALLARTIMDEEKFGAADGEYGPKEGGGYGDRSGQSNYTEFQKKVNSAAEQAAERFIKPDPKVMDRELAPMGMRLLAWFIDGMLVFLAAAILTLFFTLVIREFGDGYGHYSEGLFEHFYLNVFRGDFPGIFRDLMYGTVPMIFSGIYVFFLQVVCGVSVFSTLCIWLSNGYTPGKWLVQIRVVKVTGEKIHFLDALFREFLIKGIANNLLRGVLNAGSFIWGCVTEDNKTVQDLAAQTTVIKVDRPKRY